MVRAESLGDKLLVHNYGHGGAGVTLCWGTAELAVEQIATSGRLGPAGTRLWRRGLATARLLQSRGSGVTVYAREQPPDTTSNVAGALWYPHLVVDEGHRTPVFDAQFERAAKFCTATSRVSSAIATASAGGNSPSSAVHRSKIHWEYTLLRDLSQSLAGFNPRNTHSDCGTRWSTP